MYTIEVDFEVFKKLTVLRATEDITYNDVIRELLGLNVIQKKQTTSNSSQSGWQTKNVHFPVGTEFRAQYKGNTYYGKIEGNSLIVNGKSYESPSSAAMSITKSSVNGWRFWECRLPGKNSWQLIDSLRR